MEDETAADLPDAPRRWFFDPEHMNVWCEGCGEDAPLDPAEVDGQVVMICDRCYRELTEA